MNVGYFGGKITEVGKFKFIYGDDLTHKSMIDIWVTLSDEGIVKFRGYDDMADKILRNEFEYVYITGKVRTDGFVEITGIEKV